jgi:Protein of unknown function (DUF2971)
MTEYFYRYRPIKAVLDEFHELENQEIYFSTPDELNDPMEGFKDLFWLGDEIVWRNFLKHYVLCLLQAASYCFIAGDKFDPNILRNIVFWVPQELPDAPIREVYQRVSAKFMAESAVQAFVSLVAARATPIRRHELTGYLGALHLFAIKIVLDDFQNRGLLSLQGPGTQLPPRQEIAQQVITMMNSVPKIKSSRQPPGLMFETLFAATEATLDQTMLIAEYNLPDRDTQKPRAFLLGRFPTAYVTALDRLVHRDWYVACFAKIADNHSMWSIYADGHRGVCLMFKATATAERGLTVPIEMVTSAHGSTGKPTSYSSSFVPQEFKPVRYGAQYPAIDFFRSLGTISEMHLNNFWYLGEDGSFSKCREAIYADTDAWRANYWRTFGESALHKTPEWKHEEEYRIVVHSLFDMSAKEKRKLKYRFQDLAGVVFGARTDIEDKLKIMRIIDAKCAKEKRGDFAFSEILYLHAESRFKLFPLDLLKIKHH